MHLAVMTTDFPMGSVQVSGLGIILSGRIFLDAMGSRRLHFPLPAPRHCHKHSSCNSLVHAPHCLTSVCSWA